MRDFFDLLDDLADKAIEHQPKVKDFGRPERETLEDRPFLTTEDAPQWHSNSELKEDQRNAAAAVHVWLTERVYPVLDAIAKDADAAAVITGGLPKPRLPKKPAKDARGRLRSDSAWDRKFRIGAVFLWAVWATWNDLVGTKWPVPPAPEYPDLERLPAEKRERFKALITTSPAVALALDGRGFARRVMAALQWLRAAITKPARQAGDAKAGGGDTAKASRRRLPHDERLARVLAFIKSSPDLPEREVARETRIPASTFRQWPEYRAMREMLAGKPPSGHKTHDGRVEAHD